MHSEHAADIVSLRDRRQGGRQAGVRAHQPLQGSFALLAPLQRGREVQAPSRVVDPDLIILERDQLDFRRIDHLADQLEEGLIVERHVERPE